MKRKRNQQTCTCWAYPFPHRKGGGKCEGFDKYCPHGYLNPHHPDYDASQDYCAECAREEAGDIKYHALKEG